jgi:glycosyltransferase involved in cell wall biosynthesis
MRILIVNRYMSIYGGAEQLVKELSSNLTRRKIEHLIVTLNISQEVIQRMPQANVVTPARNFPYALRSSSLSSSAGILKEIYYLRRLIKRHYRDFDVINVHNFPANWVTGGLRKPVVWM